MSDLIRLASGQVTAYEILSNDDYLVINWPRQTDMTPAIQWSCSQPKEVGVMKTLYSSGLELGSSKSISKYAGQLKFFLGSTMMREYLANEILQGRPKPVVTAYCATVYGFEVFVGELENPFFGNSTGSFVRFNDNMYHTITLSFNRASILTVSNLLLETSDVLLLENGDSIALEQQ